MDGVAVSPPALDRYARELLRSAEDTEAMLTYVRDHGDVDRPAAGTVLLPGWQGHDNFKEAAEENLSALREHLEQYGNAVRIAAEVYRTLEDEGVEELDQTFPDVERPAGDAPSRPVTDQENEAGERADVESLLRPPSMSHGWGQEEAPYNRVRELANLVSPMAWIVEFTKLAFNRPYDWDPLGAIAEQLAGDWEQFGRAGQMWGYLAEGFEALRTNVAHANAVLDASWHGNAADACYVAGTELASYCDRMQALLEEVEQRYDGLMRSAYLAATGVADGLQIVLDLAIAWAVAASAGAVTGPAAMLFTGAAVAILASAMGVALTVLQKLGNVLSALSTLGGALFGQVSTLPHVPEPPRGWQAGKAFKEWRSDRNVGA